MTLAWLSEMTWKEVAGLDRSRVVALLPVGAIEAHGPHLPLATDGIIAEAMAAAAARRLARHGWLALGLPTLAYTAAPFAAAFPGTLSLRPETVTAVIADLAGALSAGGFRHLAIANAHLDPAHLRSLHAAADAARDAGLTVAFPDLTRKPWALRLTAEFKSGACHAGCFESSIVLAARGDLVREALRQALPANPASLSQAIRAGKSSFAEASGPEAYFGDPAAATREEGEETLEALGAILAEAVLDSLGLRT
ncbi:MAG TPA: creatininase family protein [Thermoanaerobaculia bacterium]|nr:creatininase family protein [Thermoanaerobaculia bacterium]